MAMASHAGRPTGLRAAGNIAGVGNPMKQANEGNAAGSDRREAYAERHSVLAECAQQGLAGQLEISGAEDGLQTVGWLHSG
jgi:hypothetical protein